MKTLSEIESMNSLTETIYSSPEGSEYYDSETSSKSEIPINESISQTLSSCNMQDSMTI